MRRLGLPIAAAMLLGVGAGTAQAHHSAIQFDLAHPVPVAGVVKMAKFANPHTMLVLTVSDAKGTRDITYEGHSLNNYYRDGWRKGMVKAGDHIVINCGPLRDGADGGYALGIQMADGKRVGRW